MSNTIEEAQRAQLNSACSLVLESKSNSLSHFDFGFGKVHHAHGGWAADHQDS
jgi:hypothetical protein